MKVLSDTDLQDFRGRMLQAVTYGYDVALADEYVAALAAEVGQEIVPEGLTKGSATHLLALADETLAHRAGGGRKHKAKKPEPKVEDKKDEPAKDAEPAKTDEPVKDAVKDAEPAKDEPKTDDSKSEVEDDDKDKKKSKKR